MIVPMIGWSQTWEENGEYTYSNKDITLKVTVFEYGEEISVIINNHSKQEIIECEGYWHSINMNGVDENYDGPDGFYDPSGCDFDFELSESSLRLSMYLWSYDENKNIRHILYLN